MSGSTAHRGSWTVDLLFLLVFTGLGGLVVGSDLTWMPVRVPLAISLVLFVPGYALVSVLFPRQNVPRPSMHQHVIGLGLLERCFLGVLSSAAIVPALAYALNFTPYGITVRPLMSSIVGLSVPLIMFAFIRRYRSIPDERFRVWLPVVDDVGRYFRVRPRSLEPDRPFEPRSGGEVLLNVLMVVGLIVLLATVGFAAFTPPVTEEFTELYLLTENDDGDLVAGEYPASMDEAKADPIHVAIENRETRSLDYTVVVKLQSLDHEGVGSTVTNDREIDRIGVAADRGETVVTAYTFEADHADSDNRITFLLYRDAVPENPTRENAYRSVHLDMSE